MSVQKRSGPVPADMSNGTVDLPEWWVYRGVGEPLQDNLRPDRGLPPAPPWRTFDGGPVTSGSPPKDDRGDMERRLGRGGAISPSMVDHAEVNVVNAALVLRRPLLVTGPPGAGKSTLAFQVANELRLGRVIRWHVTSNTTFKSGLYNYDAIARAEAVAVASRRGEDVGGDRIGDFVRLGPLATAFLPTRLPRVLLIDELDKSEIDLPNDLLEIFEAGTFTIPELERIASHTPTAEVFTNDPDHRATITGGRVTCRAFPIVVITSNGERDFPPAFLRRCLQLEMKPPNAQKIAAIVDAHFARAVKGMELPDAVRDEVIREFTASGEAGALSADRVLDALFLVTSGNFDRENPLWPELKDALWQRSRAV